MAASRTSVLLIERLPPVRGRLTADAPLAGITWFGVGGPAEVMFRPADRDDLASLLAAKPEGVPVTVIGVGSNLLVRDGGIPGIVIRLGRSFAEIEAQGTEILAGGAALDINVARAAAEAEIMGLEFLAGIPGTLGGALRMNAGAYSCEMLDVTVWAEAVDGAGCIHKVDEDALGFAYRSSAAPEDWIFTRALLAGVRGERAQIARRIEEIQSAREKSQPVRTRTGGSTFKNPPGQSAWMLIDKAGCRGLRRGGAIVSEQHCNFLINTGDATAADLEALGEEVRRRVFEDSGVALEWEIRRVGQPLAAGPKAVEEGGA
ncbi:MAG: UDP-N-acetylmuramate dehydrogenase [Alphaproteobacteria bacterium]